MNGSDLIVRTLQNHGIDWMATLCGHGLDPLFHAAHDAGMRLIDTRNEQTASYIAESYGRLTRRPGVCAVSSGVAHINALTGVANAWFDHSPMLLISGAASTATEGKGHFQDMEQDRIAQPLCKYSRTIRQPGELVPCLEEALHLAQAPQPGPVHLTIPMDVQNAKAAASDSPSSHQPRPFLNTDVEEIASALKSCRRPVIIAGSGVFYSQTGPDMLAFCEHYRIPVVTPIWDRGSVDQASPVFIGVVGAASGGPAVLVEADCTLVAGAENDYRVGYFAPPAIRHATRIVQMGDAWRALNRACEQRGITGWPEWLSECASRRDQFRAQIEARGNEQARQGLHAVHIVKAIESVLSYDPVLLIDGGSIGQWAHQLLCSNRYPGDWLTCGRSGVVGWGLGGGMAARLAFPERPVILLSGDGAFTFNIADLECAARQRLGFVAIVADDQAWGITRTGHVKQFGAPIASSLGSVAFDQVACALGARGVRASTPDDVARELRLAIEDSSRVTVIHAPIVGGNPA